LYCINCVGAAVAYVTPASQAALLQAQHRQLDIQRDVDELSQHSRQRKFRRVAKKYHRTHNTTPEHVWTPVYLPPAILVYHVFKTTALLPWLLFIFSAGVFEQRWDMDIVVW
jgi:hypothetical protein